MPEAAFIAGDWGTTHLRLALCTADGIPLEVLNGPGAARASGIFAQTFSQLTARWRAHANLPAILSGMVGSNLGWRSVPYVGCPAGLEQISRAIARIDDHRVLIIPGLRCHNACGAPDVLRGEETQILGALRAEPQLKRGLQLLCLPGTHTKWVVLEDGQVREFLTAPTGELYALLREHSVLVRAEAASTPTPAFVQAVRHTLEERRVDGMHLIFECRTRQLLGEFSAGEAAAYLSGLLIGRDVEGALKVFGHLLRQDTPLMLIGSAVLTALFSAALGIRGVPARLLEGDTTSRLGCAQLFSLLRDRGNIHAV